MWEQGAGLALERLVGSVRVHGVGSCMVLLVHRSGRGKGRRYGSGRCGEVWGLCAGVWCHGRRGPGPGRPGCCGCCDCWASRRLQGEGGVDGRVARGVVRRRLTTRASVQRRVLCGRIHILSPSCRPLLWVVLQVLRMLRRGPRPLGRAASQRLLVATAGVGRVVRCPIPCRGNGTLSRPACRCPVSCWGMSMPAKNSGCGSIPRRRGMAIWSCAVAGCCMQRCDRHCSCGMGKHDPGRRRAVAGSGTGWGLLWCGWAGGCAVVGRLLSRGAPAAVACARGTGEAAAGC